MRHAIKIALFMLAGVAAFLVYGFTAQVAPQAIAVLSAGSLVLTYIGLAFAEIPQRQQHNARRVAWAAMVVEALYGTLYALSHYYPGFFAAPPWFAAIPLAALHGASFSMLAFFVSLFIFHERQRQPVAQPERTEAQELAQAIILAVRSLPQPAQLPEQATYARPAEVRTQPVLKPKTTCDACGTEASAMQLRTAVQHGGWRCACGVKVGFEAS